MITSRRAYDAFFPLFLCELCRHTICSSEIFDRLGVNMWLRREDLQPTQPSHPLHLQHMLYRLIENVRNLNGYNAVQNLRNQVAQNPRVQNVGNQNGLIGVPENANLIGNGNLKEEAGIQLQAEEFDLMAAAADLDEIEEVNANCILMANLQQASTSGTQTGKALVYDTDGSAENDNNVTSEVTSVEQSGETVEQHPANFEETQKKKLKSDSKTREDELLDKQIQLEKKIKELNNILVKTGQSIQTIFMLSPKPDSFYYTEQKIALGYQNPFYLKQAQKKQQSLYDGNVLLEKHDPPVVHDSEETLQLAQETKFVGDFKSLAKEDDESLAKHKALELELEIELTLNSDSTPQESKVVKNDKVIAPRMFRINPFKTSREAKHVPNNKHKADVSIKEKQKKHQLKVKKPKKVGLIERLATPKPSKPRFLLRWSPTGRLFDQKGKIVDFSKSESQSDCSNGDNACNSDTLKPKIKRFPNSTSFLGRVYFVEGLGHNLFSVRQFCDSDLEVAFRRDACFVRNLEGVDLLKGDRSTKLYTINLNEMASTSPICLMARASSTKSWLWHQRLSHLNFGTINDLARNNLVLGLPKFKYHKEHLFPSCEQGKSKRASHPPKPIPNSRQRLHLLHMDLCGPMRIASINEKRVVERRNWTLVEAARTMLIFSRAPLFLWAEAIATACFTQNRSIIHRRFNKTPYELINDKNRISPFFIVYNRRTKKIMETMNVSFDELSTMAFEQRSSKPRLQSMTSGQINSGLDLTYASSTITTQQPSEGELDLLFKAMYDDYIGGQPSATARTVPTA
nr:integrase, catalytic region, zinc finger, CCHC-type, peptidase aspartic, catalytic [Tanacetum cinerariifolium]